MDPLRYLRFLKEIADEISDTIAEANEQESEKMFVVYYADLIGNLYWRKTFEPEGGQAQIGAWSEAPGRYIIWHGWSNEVDRKEIEEEIIALIESDYDEIREALAPEN